MLPPAIATNPIPLISVSDNLGIRVSQSIEEKISSKDYNEAHPRGKSFRSNGMSYTLYRTSIFYIRHAYFFYNEEISIRNNAFETAHLLNNTSRTVDPGNVDTS